MSCKNCEDKPVVSYVRIDEANVEFIGCEKHLKRLINLLRSGIYFENRKGEEE